MSKKTILKMSVYSLLILLPCFTLTARYAGGAAAGGHSSFYGAAGRSPGENYGNNRHYVDPNYYYNGYDAGYYNTVIMPQDPESQPGMSDDSDELYNSYLEHNKRPYGAL